MVEKKTFNWGHFIIGILFILAALLSFANPTKSLVGISIILGVVAIADGIFDIFVRNRIRKYTGYRSNLLIVVGVIDIIIGVLLLSNIAASVMALPIVFAIWFIIDAIENLMLSGTARFVSPTYYWFTVIVHVLGIIVGVMLLANPVQSAWTISFLVGFNLLWFGILNIVEAFA